MPIKEISKKEYDVIQLNLKFSYFHGMLERAYIDFAISLWSHEVASSRMSRRKQNTQELIFFKLIGMLSPLACGQHTPWCGLVRAA